MRLDMEEGNCFHKELTGNEMNIFLRCLVKVFLATAFLLSAVTYAAGPKAQDTGVIEFVNRPGWTVESYLTFFLTKIPMNQIQPGAGDTYRVSGPVRIAFKNVPDALKVELTVEIGRAFKGERPVSGALLETSGAELILAGEEPALAAALAEQQKPSMEELGFVHTPMDREQIRREVENRQRLEERQLSENKNCGSFLGHIEK